MKKQNDSKKSLKWLIPVCILAVLAIVGGILGFSMGSTDKPAPVEQVNKLYWNVDGETYRSQEATRFVGSDGYIYITFSCEGEQMRLPVADMTTANKIDALEVMGLEFDENGVVVDCRRAEDITDGIIANRYYVTKVDGNTVTCNSSVTLEGYDVVFDITENTGVWDVGSVGITCGIAGSVNINDQIIAIRDYDGSVSHVFVVPYTAPDDIYWNVERKYDSTSKRSTREMDAGGTYTFLLAVNGEQVTVKTRDYDIANAMDTMAARCFGLEFDENGYVSKVIHAGTATGGGSCASWHHVDLLQGNHIETFKVGAAAVFSGTLADDVKIFDVSGMGEFVGQPTELKVGDQVHCLKDSMGRVCVVFVVSRMAESEIYWNVERKWDSKTSTSTRKPDANGWYWFEVAVRGKQITVKTQDKTIVDSIDGRAAKCFGLKLNGDVIEKMYLPQAVTGGGTFASWYDITAMDGKVITVKKGETGDVRVGTLTDDCEIYNVSSGASMVGEVTELKVGDRVHTLKDLDGNICVAFVVTRFEDLPTYYNLTRKWDATKESTTRVPDENGYYVFEMVYKGKQVTVKTKDKSIASDIDSQAAKCVALKVVNGIVYKAIHPSNTVACKGGPSSSYTYVTSVSKYGFKTKKVENGKITKTYDETFAPNCKVYNVSDNYTDHKGEETTVKTGDYVHCLRNADEQVVLVYVLTRFEDLGVYYNLDRKWDSENSTTLRTTDADGLYSFRMAHDGKEVTVKTASLEVANAIDSQAAKVVGIEFDGKGLAIKAIHAKGTQECKGGIGVSYATVTKIEGNQVTTYKSETDVTTTFTISDNPNAFDVSSDYKNNQGERTTLRVGDYIHCLKNADGDAHYIYIMRRVAVMTEVDHTCQHVTENVTWYEWDGKSAMGVSGYYVLTQDAELSSRITISKDMEVTICLNGHTVTSTDRFFSIRGKLNICDHKDADGNYTGKLSSAYSHTLDAEGKVSAKAYGALAYLYNTDTSSELNIYGGNFEHTGTLTDGGLVYVANTRQDENKTALFSLYDGTLTGGRVTGSGGAVLISNIGGFAMYGGTITDCSAATGGAVRMNTSLGVLLMEGGTITGCTSTGNGAGISVDSGSFMMSGGTITGNTASGSGGGVNMQGGEFVMTGGSLDGNTGNEGGNLRINKAGAVVLMGDALICNGSAKNGGNITMFGKLAIMENTRITGGTATNRGSAISIYSNYDDAEVELDILGGTVEGTIRYDSAKGKSVVMYVLGGNVDTVNFYKNANGTVDTELYVGGTANVKNINLEKGKVIQIDADGLEDTASIGVSMADVADPFTTITDAADEACFHAADENAYKVENRNNELYLVSNLAPHTHCVCGGHITNVGDHTECDTAVEWTAWDGTTALADGGYYYAYDADGDGKISVSAVKEIKAGWNVSLCLNGVTVEGTGSRIFLLRGSADTTVLNICDCHEESEWGSMISSHTGIAPLIHSYNNGIGPVQINIFGGNFRSTETSATYGDHAGLIRLGNTTTDAAGAKSPGVLNMYAGNISGGSGKTGGNLYISNGCTFNMYGGSITGGYASNGGGNVYVCSSATVYLTGNVNISGSASGGSLYLANNSVLTVGDLADTASVGISMSGAGQFTTVTDVNDAACFTSDDSTYKVENNNGKLSLVKDTSGTVTGHTHCICGGNAKGVGKHTVCTDVTFQPWGDNESEWTSLPTSGTYYLTHDVKLGSMVTLRDKTTLRICLNGYTITGPGYADYSGSTALRVFLVRDADLDITDCQGTGTITNEGYSSLNGGVIYMYSGTSTNYNSSVNLYGGTITMTGQVKSGGVLYLGNNSNNAYFATFNMYGGIITGGNSANDSGNVVISNSSVFNLYGGTVSNGTAVKNGGNINVNAGTLNISGGQIIGGTAGTYGGGVSVGSSAKNLVSVSGTAYINGNTVSGANNNVALLNNNAGTAFAKLTVGTMEPGACVYVNTSYGATTAGRAFGTAATEADAAYIYSDKIANDVIYSEGSLYFGASTGHKHCVCVGNVEDHDCFQDETWTAWGDDESEWTKLPASGTYYLTHDVTLSAQVEIKNGNELTLCLNGHTITGAGGTTRVFLTRTGKLSITDCQTNADGSYKGTITNATTSANGGILYMYSGTGSTNITFYTGQFDLYGGNLTVTGTQTGGGVIYLGNKDTKGVQYVTFNMYGGSISGGNTTKAGGNVCVSNGSVFNMYGGQITGGTSAESGGNVNGYNGKLNICGGSISGGNASGSGNDVYLAANCSLTVGGTANIGEVYLTSGKTITVSQGEPLTAGAAIGVVKAALGAVAENVTDEEIAKYFSSINTDWEVVFDDETDSLKLAEKAQ